MEAQIEERDKQNSLDKRQQIEKKNSEWNKGRNNRKREDTQTNTHTAVDFFQWQSAASIKLSVEMK